MPCSPPRAKPPKRSPTTSPRSALGLRLVHPTSQSISTGSGSSATSLATNTSTHCSPTTWTTTPNASFSRHSSPPSPPSEPPRQTPSTQRRSASPGTAGLAARRGRVGFCDGGRHRRPPQTRVTPRRKPSRRVTPVGSFPQFGALWRRRVSNPQPPPCKCNAPYRLACSALAGLHQALAPLAGVPVVGTFSVTEPVTMIDCVCPMWMMIGCRSRRRLTTRRRAGRNRTRTISLLRM